MRKFIISDLHGNGEVYDSIMAYLDNISLKEKVELFINGDLIDYGFQSFDMIMDVMDRMKGKGNVQIHYLGGNHELMMHQSLKARGKGKAIPTDSDWFEHDASSIEGVLDGMEDSYDEACDSLRDFSGSLNVIHVFDEKVLDKPILLVHGQAPLDVSRIQSMKIKDDNIDVFHCVWKREVEYGLFGVPIGKNRVGNPEFFTIVGHHAVSDPSGFHYYQENNDSFFRIDGGCHPYVKGDFSYDHVPLVELKDNYLSILVFNHNNQIINGYYFDGSTVLMDENELKKNRAFLDSSLNGNGEANKQFILEMKKDGIL